MKKILKYSLFIFLIGIILVGGITFKENQAKARESKNAKDMAFSLGTFMKNNPKLLQESLKTFNDQNLNSIPNEIARINDLPITDEVLNLRLGYISSMGYDIDKNAVFNMLVEDKIILDFVNKHNITPSKNEINLFINGQKQNYNKSLEVKSVIDSFCSAANITLEDYWGDYEYYNIYRFLSNDKASVYVIDKGIKDGKLIKEASFKQKMDFWNSYLLNLKANALIQMNNRFNNLNLKVDTSRLYE